MPTDLPRRIAETMLSQEGTGPWLGIVIDEVREGYARLRMTVMETMLNGHGTAHGGILFTLADTAFAYACNSRNVVTVAAQASIAFLSPARLGEILIAEATEHCREGRSGTYGVKVHTADGRAVADFLGLSRSLGGTILPPETEGQDHG